METNNLSRNVRVPLALALLTLNSGYALTTGSVTLMLLVNILYLALEVLLSRGKLRLKKSGLVFFLVFAGLMLVACAINLDFANYKEYIRILIFVFLALYLCSAFGAETILRRFCDLMFVSAIISLVFYTVIHLAPRLPFPVVTNAYGTRYVTCFVSSINLQNFNRNCGLFWEPGLFAAMLFVWMLLENLYLRRPEGNIPRQFVCALALVSAMSTSAYVYLVLLVLIALVHKPGRSAAARLVIILAAVILCLVVYFRYDSILETLVRWNPTVFRKLVDQSASVTDRVLGPMTDLQIAFRHPLGVGESRVNPMVRELSQLLYDTLVHTRTSTLTFFVAAFGWLSGIAVLYALWRFVRLGGDHSADRATLMLGLLYACFSTPLNNVLVFWVMLFCGLQNTESFSEVVL